MTRHLLRGRKFRRAGAVPGGEVDADTLFAYGERDGEVWAVYSGGTITHGFLVGTRTDRVLEARYVQRNTDGDTGSGRLTSQIEELPDGRLRLHETWAWETRAGQGTGVLEEVPRPTGRVEVELREVDRDNVDALLRLQVAPHQQDYVADNAKSIAQGSVTPGSWYRGVYVDSEPVGFVMLHDERQDEGRWYLWRLMVDAHHQRGGVGRAVLDAVCNHIRAEEPPHELFTSWVPAPGGPEPFYLSYGFEATGEVDDGEVVGRLVRWPTP